MRLFCPCSCPRASPCKGWQFCPKKNCRLRHIHGPNGILRWRSHLNKYQPVFLSFPTHANQLLLITLHRSPSTWHLTPPLILWSYLFNCLDRNLHQHCTHIPRTPSFFPHIAPHTHALTVSKKECVIDFIIIWMASFWLLTPLFLALMASPFLSLPSQLKVDMPAISAAPALLPNPPLLSPFLELSPEIAPLLPSQGGTVPSSTGSSMPTIPSNPSPPNPDEMASVGPGSALSPSGSLPASSAPFLSLIGSLVLAVPMGSMAYWSMVVFVM